MRLATLFACLPLLVTSTGCFGPAADVIANGIVLGGPADPAFEEVAQVFEAGVMLARPLSLTDLESNLVLDADAVWLTIGGAPVELRGENNGLYFYDSSIQPNVSYQAGTQVELHAHVDGKEGVATVLAPAAPDLSGLPLTHPSGSSLVVEMSEEYALVYGAVIDTAGGVVWDDRPSTSQEVISELANASSVERYLFPPDAFPDAGAAYGVALVGIRTAEAPDFSNFEKFWSNVGVGSVGTGYLTTLP